MSNDAAEETYNKFLALLQRTEAMARCLSTGDAAPVTRKLILILQYIILQISFFS